MAEVADDIDDLLREELSRGDAALARAETKVSILLAVFSPIVTVGVVVLPTAATPTVVRLAFWAALLSLAVALLLLLLSVVPRLRDSGFVTVGSMTDADLAEYVGRLAADPQRWHRERLLVVAKLGATKFRLLRAATTLITVALLLAVAAGLLAATAA